MEMQLNENDIERVLSMLNDRTRKHLIQLLKEDKELDDFFYGTKRHFLVIIKKFKPHFYCLLAYYSTSNESLKREIKKDLGKLKDSEVFSRFIEDGTKFSVEDCKLLDLENLNFYGSVEKIKNAKNSSIKHIYNDLSHAPEEFLKMFDKGFALNYVQRAISNVAFKTNDNFLVCAPTGVGKTVISAMRIFKLKNEVECLKVAYVAPIKALATEVYEFFKKLFPDLVVILAISDVEVDQKDLKRSNIIVGTPEKIELIMRNTLLIFDLVVLDEIHILNDTRGWVIEGIVARAMTLSRTALIGMSATVYNYEDIGIFLGVSYYNLFYFDDSYRPSPLTYDVILADNLEKELDEHIVDTETPSIIFVHSQKDTMNTAEHLKMYFDRVENIYDLLVSEKDISEFESLEDEIRELIFYQIGIHHSGLKKNTRRIVEDFFKKGIIKILVSTSTLAWGVNLPIKTVIIKGSTYYNPEVGDYVELSSMEIRQMFGRAGRYPNMVGCKGLLISTTTSNLYFNQTIESHILSNICNLVLTEIFLGISDFKSLMEWFSNTFYVTRLLKYNQNSFQLCKDILYTAMTKLEECNMINGFEMTEYGKIAVKYFLDYKDVKAMVEGIKKGMYEDSFLDIIGEVKEFKNLKGDIDAYSTDGYSKSKFSKLVNFYLHGEKSENELISQSISQIVQNFPRIVNSFFELLVLDGMKEALYVFEFIKAFDECLLLGRSPLRHFDVDPKIVEDIEKKKMPYKVFRNLSENDFKELGISGNQYLKYLPNFEMNLSIFNDLEDKIILFVEIDKKFDDTKMKSISYLLVIRDFSNKILLSDVIYFYKEVETMQVVYSIPKRRYIQIDLKPYEMIDATYSKAFDLNLLTPIYSICNVVNEDTAHGDEDTTHGDFDLVVYDQNQLEIERDDILIVKDDEAKRSFRYANCSILTHCEFLKMNKFESKRYILMNTHEMAESGFYLQVINLSKEKEMNLILAGYKPSTKIDPSSIYISSVNKYWDRVFDYIRALYRSLDKYPNASHLIVVSNHNVVEVLRDRIQKKFGEINDGGVYKIVFFKDVDASHRYDVVHIFDTQYLDYSSSTLLDYKLSVLFELSRLGRYPRFYIKRNKEGIYLDRDILQVRYKCKEVEEVTTTVLETGLSLPSLMFLRESIRNNLGIKSILSVIFQVEELREEVTNPEYKGRKDVDLGLKFLRVQEVMRSREKEDGILSKVLNYLLEVCSEKKFLKTMFNLIFILQKMNKSFNKFFRVDQRGNLEVEGSVEYPVIFFLIREDSSYEKMEVNTPGVYEIMRVEESVYILCDKYPGYEKITK